MADDVTSQNKQSEMPSEAGPLGAYNGQRPPAPDWFETALSRRPETRFTDGEDARVHYQTWGDPSKPGLLLCHGNGAHAQWWDFIAPFFAKHYYLVAPTFSGMGDSDWRSSYNMETFTRNQLNVAETAGLFGQATKPIIVGHSFGGFVSVGTASKHGDLFGGTIIVDTPIRPSEDPHDGPPRRNRPNKVYPTIESALARFRLAPPQLCENHYAMDYIARHSLKETVDESGNAGWVWKFDPSIWRRFRAEDRPMEDLLQDISCPLAFFRGAQSALVTDEIWSFMQGLVSNKVPFVSIPDARHHVMLDQPLAFVSALQALLETWRANA